MSKQKSAVRIHPRAEQIRLENELAKEQLKKEILIQPESAVATDQEPWQVELVDLIVGGKGMPELEKESRLVSVLYRAFQRANDAERREFVAQLSAEELHTLKSSVVSAEVYRFRIVLFGKSKPTLKRLQTWLDRHAGSDFPDNSKHTIARAITHFKSEFDAALRYIDSPAHPECTITAEHRGTRGVRFLVRTAGTPQRPLSSKKTLPSLAVVCT